MLRKILTPVAAATVLSCFASGVALAQSANEFVVLYAGENLSGEAIVVKRSVANLNETNVGINANQQANDFARSVKTSGRWRVCMDRDYRTRCRDVAGELLSLGNDGGQISSVRYLGPAARTAFAMPTTRQSSGAPRLTMYPLANLGGQARAITGNQSNLTVANADNYAFSLLAEGRWEVCMDQGFRAGCRIVEGRVADLGGDGGSISSARFVGTGAAASMAATTGSAVPVSNMATAQPAAAPSVPDAYVFATTYRGKFKHELTLSALTGSVTGEYVNTESLQAMDEIYRSSGAYGITSGTVTGTMSGNVMTGRWDEDPTQSAGLQYFCEGPGARVVSYGQFILRFNADRTSFTGGRNSCDNDASDGSEWTGRLVRRVAGSPPAAATASRSNSTTQGSGAATASSRASSARSAATPAQLRQDTVADRIAREAAAAAEQRAKDETRRGVNRAIDGLFRRPR
jgi:hypothetical protein